MMTRKDYVAVAEILSNYQHFIGWEEFRDLVEDFAEMFANDNPNFKEDKFVQACGLEPNE